MRVRLKKNVDDCIWEGDDYDILTLNPMSKALTDHYLPQWSPSPLKAMLMQRLGTIKQMYLYLKVRCKENIVQSISLECNLSDDIERAYSNQVDWSTVTECLTTFFQSIGYTCIKCTGEKDVLLFIQRMKKDIPLTETYFEIIDN